MESYSVLGLGIATLDTIITVPSFPEPNTKLHCNSLHIQGGGNCANTLVALSRLGIETAMISKTGKDDIGDKIKESLKNEGVGVKRIIQEGKKSSSSYIIVDKSTDTRTIINKRGADYREIIPLNEDTLNGIDLVYLDGRFSKTAEILAEMADEIDLPVVLEAESDKYGLQNLFRYVDVIITSESFHEEHFKDRDFKKNLNKLLDMGPSIVVTTLGANGVIAATKEGFIECEAFKINPVDTTGAGDAFIGGFIYGYLHKLELADTLRFASYIAAQKCESFGARTGLPYRKDIPPDLRY